MLNSTKEGKMKKLLIITVVIGLLGLSCGSGGDPEATVSKFFDAMKAGDADTAAECIEGGMTDEEKEMFETMAPFMEGLEIEVTGHEIDGESAVVFTTISVMGQTSPEEFELVLIDGEWKMVEAL